MKSICTDCGLPEEEHCKFNPATMPSGCKCDPREWGTYFVNKIPAVCCDAKPEIDEDGLCTRCEHLEECHDRTKIDTIQQG